MEICDYTENQVTIKCKRHKKFSPSYILLNDIDEGNFLICNQCLEKDEKYDSLEVKHYQSIEPLLVADEKTIFAKWPPLKQQGILRQIQQHLSNDDNHLNHQQDIVIAYFDQLVSAVVKHIEEIKKVMLQKCSILPDLERKLYTVYNEIAEKEQLKEVFLRSNTSFDEANSKIREIIKQKDESKEKNEESLMMIFNSYLTSLKQFDQNTPIEQMKEIVALIKKINFFPESQKIKDQTIHSQKIVNSIVKAIENKTNFFSQEFNDKIKAKLNELSFIFNESQVDQIYTEGHEEFLTFFRSKRQSEQQLDKLEVLVDNLKTKENNIELTPQVKLITDLINSPANYLTKEFSEQISLLLRQLTPFFDEFEVTSAFQNQNKPIDFRNITQEQVVLIHKLVDKMSEMKYEINPNEINKLELPYSHHVLQVMGKQYVFSSQVNLLFQQYPICEFLTNPTQKLSFIKGYYSNSQTEIIVKNVDDQKMKFTSTDSDWVNIMSNWYLKQNCTYQIVFELNYKSRSSFYFLIGISSNEQAEAAHNDNLSFYIDQDGIVSGYGMDKVKKGRKDNLNLQKQLQLTVNQSKGILEIGDYPNLNNIMEVDDDMKSKLQQDILYQIVFSLYNQNDQLIIKSISEIHS